MRRFLFLDAIRGIAALFILARHTPTFWGVQFHYSYLAVDLFFILSGFVIAHAYDSDLRAGRLGLWRFVLVRLVRLYPLFLLSLGVSLAVEMARMVHRHDAGQLLAVLQSAALTAFYIPSSLPGEQSLYPLNGVYWSLLFELLVNLLYAALRPVLRVRVLYAVIAASAALLVWLAARNDGLNVGYQWGAESFAGGMVRAIFGFSVGLVLYRWRLRSEAAVQPLLGTLLVALVLAAPFVGGVFDLAAVLVVFPAAVWMAATTRSSRANRILLLLGAASYPLYVLHFPIAQLTAGAVHGMDRYAPLPGIAFALGMVAVAAAADRWFDVPVRRWLAGRLLGRSTRAGAAISTAQR